MGVVDEVRVCVSVCKGVDGPVEQVSHMTSVQGHWVHVRVCEREREK